MLSVRRESRILPNNIFAVLLIVNFNFCILNRSTYNDFVRKFFDTWQSAAGPSLPRQFLIIWSSCCCGLFYTGLIYADIPPISDKHGIFMIPPIGNRHNLFDCSQVLNYSFHDRVYLMHLSKARYLYVTNIASCYTYFMKINFAKHFKTWKNLSLCRVNLKEKYR